LIGGGGALIGFFQSFLSLSLKKKLFIAYIIMSLFFLSIIALMYSGMTSARHSIGQINDRNKNIQTVTMLKTNIHGIRAAFLRFVIDDDREVWDAQEDVINKLVEETKTQIRLIKETKYKDKVLEIEETFYPFADTIVKELIPAVREGNKKLALNILSTVQAKRSRVFITAIDSMIEAMEEENTKEMQLIDSENKKTIIRSLSFTLAIFLFMIIFSYWFISNYIVKVLNKVTETAQLVSKGDLRVNIELNINDEFGRLARDVNNIVATIKQALSDISQKTFVLLKDVTSMSFAGQEVCHRIDKDLEMTTSAATATEQMSATALDISKNINILAESSEKAKNASLEGRDMLIKTTYSIEEVNNQIGNASAKVLELTEYSKKINDIVVLIKDIADQTNLLALNAAIEAARAGEQGRGFAVVADEVRKLAYRTTNATVEINNILNSINHSTSETTTIMSQVVDKSEDANKLVKTLNESFEEIFSSFQNVTEMVQQIVSSSEEQTATASEIAKNLNGLASSSKDSSKDVKKMASSFIDFTSNAKAFLKTLNSFNDKKIQIGVIKADYILWLNRVIQIIDLKGEGLKAEEMDSKNSRMGRWYYGVGQELYGNLAVFKSIEPLHTEFHQIGKNLVESASSGDREKARLCMNEITSVMKDIFNLLDKIIE